MHSSIHQGSKFLENLFFDPHPFLVSRVFPCPARRDFRDVRRQVYAGLREPDFNAPPELEGHTEGEAKCRESRAEGVERVGVEGLGSQKLVGSRLFDPPHERPKRDGRRERRGVNKN